MDITVLGCSGGIGGGLATTSLKVGAKVLIDAGTGVDSLTLPELAAVDVVYLTHSHLDHIACLPLMIDSVGSLRHQPLCVRALPETLQALSDHIFNNVIWPDFRKIPTAAEPWLIFEPIAVGDTFPLADGGTLQVLPVTHCIPAVGYAVSAASGTTLAFSGDTGPSPVFWQALSALPRLDHLIVECAFSDSEAAIAVAARHYTPETLVRDLPLLPDSVDVHISHLKPNGGEAVMMELSQQSARSVFRLNTGSCFRL